LISLLVAAFGVWAGLTLLHSGSVDGPFLGIAGFFGAACFLYLAIRGLWIVRRMGQH